MNLLDLHDVSEFDLNMQRKARALTLLDLEIGKKGEELRLAKAIATNNEIAAAQNKRQEDANLANDVHHQRHYFTNPIDMKSVKECISLCTFWANTKPGCDIQIIFNCQGGELFSGMMLYDFLEELKTRNHKVIVGTYGLAASMAGILLQAASPGERYVGGEAWMLIHEVASGASGSASAMRNAADFAKDVSARIRDIFLAKQADSIKKGTATETISTAEFDNKWKNNDWWLNSDEMIKLGFADKKGSPVFNAPEETPV